MTHQSWLGLSNIDHISEKISRRITSMLAAVPRRVTLEGHRWLRRLLRDACIHSDISNPCVQCQIPGQNGSHPFQGLTLSSVFRPVVAWRAVPALSSPQVCCPLSIPIVEASSTRPHVTHCSSLGSPRAEQYGSHSVCVGRKEPGCLCYRTKTACASTPDSVIPGKYRFSSFNLRHSR